MKPKVSIILPIYNVEKYLDRCMKSLLNQTMREIEIIMVDDGSPDNCPAMCDNYAQMDNRVKVIHKKNEGLGMARNSGLKIATGDYIAFLDSDDYVDLHTYETLYKTIVRCGNPEAVFCGVNKVNDKGEIYYSHCDFSEFTQIKDNDKCKRIAAEIVARLDKKTSGKYFVSVWHALYNKEFILNNNIRFYSEKEYISEDIIFDIDFLSRAHNIVYIPDCLIYYCDNGASLSRVFRKDRFIRTQIMHHKIIEMMQKYKFPEEYKLSAHKYMIISTRQFIYNYFKNIEDKKERLEYVKDIVGQREFWNNIRKSKVKKIINFKLLLFYYPLVYNMHFIVYKYCEYIVKNK